MAFTHTKGKDFMVSRGGELQCWSRTALACAIPYLSWGPELWSPFGDLPIELQCLGSYNPTAICHQVWWISGVAMTLYEMILGHRNKPEGWQKEDLLQTAFLIAGTSPFPCIQLWAQCPHMYFKTHTSKEWQQRHQHKSLTTGFNALPILHSCPFGAGPCSRWLLRGVTWCNENQREEFDLIHLRANLHCDFGYDSHRN